MVGWIKTFIDHTQEEGSDQNIAKKLASWSNGRLDGIHNVQIFANKQYLLISKPGEFWQSDDYEVCIAEKWPIMITRRIQRKFQQGDIFFDIKNYQQEIHAIVGGLKELTSTEYSERVLLSTNDIGKWLTLEIDLISNTQRYYISEQRI